jgi:hypothetical protein
VSTASGECDPGDTEFHGPYSRGEYALFGDAAGGDRCCCGLYCAYCPNEVHFSLSLVHREGTCLALFAPALVVAQPMHAHSLPVECLGVVLAAVIGFVLPA